MLSSIKSALLGALLAGLLSACSGSASWGPTPQGSYGVPPPTYLTSGVVYGYPAGCTYYNCAVPVYPYYTSGNIVYYTYSTGVRVPDGHFHDYRYHPPGDYSYRGGVHPQRMNPGAHPHPTAPDWRFGHPPHRRMSEAPVGAISSYPNGWQGPAFQTQQEVLHHAALTRQQVLGSVQPVYAPQGVPPQILGSAYATQNQIQANIPAGQVYVPPGVPPAILGSATQTQQQIHANISSGQVQVPPGVPPAILGSATATQQQILGNVPAGQVQVPPGVPPAILNSANQTQQQIQANVPRGAPAVSGSPPTPTQVAPVPIQRTAPAVSTPQPQPQRPQSGGQQPQRGSGQSGQRGNQR